MTTRADILELAEVYIDYKVADVKSKLDSLLEVTDTATRKELATEVLAQIVSDNETYHSNACVDVNEEVSKLVSEVLLNLKKVAQGATVSPTVVDPYLVGCD